MCAGADSAIPLKPTEGLNGAPSEVLLVPLKPTEGFHDRRGPRWMGHPK